jgi:hypothetical protein
MYLRSGSLQLELRKNLVVKNRGNARHLRCRLPGHDKKHFDDGKDALTPAKNLTGS